MNDQVWDTRTRLLAAAETIIVESLSPHRVPAVDVDDSLFDELEASEGKHEKLGMGGESADFTEMVLDNLKKSGVQQADKADRLVFISMKGRPASLSAPKPWCARRAPMRPPRMRQHPKSAPPS